MVSEASVASALWAAKPLFPLVCWEAARFPHAAESRESHPQSRADAPPDYECVRLWSAWLCSVRFHLTARLVGPSLSGQSCVAEEPFRREKPPAPVASLGRGLVATSGKEVRAVSSSSFALDGSGSQGNQPGRGGWRWGTNNKQLNGLSLCFVEIGSFRVRTGHQQQTVKRFVALF